MKNHTARTNGTGQASAVGQVSGTLSLGITFYLNLYGYANAPTERLKTQLSQASDGLEFGAANTLKKTDSRDVPCTCVRFLLKPETGGNFYFDNASSFTEFGSQMDQRKGGLTEKKLIKLAKQLTQMQLTLVKKVKAEAVFRGEKILS